MNACVSFIGSLLAIASEPRREKQREPADNCEHNDRRFTKTANCYGEKTEF